MLRCQGKNWHYILVFGLSISLSPVAMTSQCINKLLTKENTPQLWVQSSPLFAILNDLWS